MRKFWGVYSLQIDTVSGSPREPSSSDQLLLTLGMVVYYRPPERSVPEVVPLVDVSSERDEVPHAAHVILLRTLHQRRHP